MFIPLAVEPFSVREFQSLGEKAMVAFIMAILLCIVIMVGLLILGWWVVARQGSVSPYTRKPMQRGEDLARSASIQVQQFMQRHDPIDNPLFDFQYAAICKDTGRIFPNCVNRFGVIVLDWSFLNKRLSGRWISWGSLTIIQQAEVRGVHDTLEGFQTEISCPDPFPKNIDSFYAMTKPGPLYVDLETKNLLGWKEVSHTQLEVLILQRPYYQ